MRVDFRLHHTRIVCTPTNVIRCVVRSVLSVVTDFKILVQVNSNKTRAARAQHFGSSLVHSPSFQKKKKCTANTNCTYEFQTI